MNERAVAIGLLGVLCAGLLALFFTTYKKEPYEVFIPPTGEAATNPLLAAQRLLDGLGYDVTSRNEFAPSIELPPSGATALALFQYDYMADDELALLLDWVGAGGHLIIEISPRYGRLYDPVFTPIGIEAIQRDGPADFTFDDDGKVIEPPEDATTRIAWDAGAAPDRENWGAIEEDNLVSIDTGDTTPLWSIHDQFGVFATQVVYDAGRITAIADISGFGNRRIAKSDHAFLLTQLVGPAREAGPVWLLHGSDFPSLWSLLVERLRDVMIAGGVLLIMCLWWASQRFGPILNPPARARKAFIEHIEANGRFLWRENADERLLGATQHAFLRDAQRRHPALRRLSGPERNRYLAKVCGVTPPEANTALEEGSARRHGDFLNRIQLIKTMWNRL